MLAHRVAEGMAAALNRAAHPPDGRSVSRGRPRWNAKVWAPPGQARKWARVYLTSFTRRPMGHFHVRADGSWEYAERGYGQYTAAVRRAVVGAGFPPRGGLRDREGDA
jgi:hypothetical protein